MSSFCKTCAQSIPEFNFFLHSSTCIPVFEKCKKCKIELLKSEMEDHLYAHSLFDEEEKQQIPVNQQAPQQNLNQINMNNSNNNIISNDNLKCNIQIFDPPRSLKSLSNVNLNQKRSELLNNDLNNNQSIKLNDQSPVLFSTFKEMSFQDRKMNEVNKEVAFNNPKKLDNEETDFFGYKLKMNNGSNLKTNNIFGTEYYKDSIITEYNPPRRHMTDIFKVEKVNQNKSVCEGSMSFFTKKPIGNNQVKNVQPNPGNF